MHLFSMGVEAYSPSKKYRVSAPPSQVETDWQAISALKPIVFPVTVIRLKKLISLLPTFLLACPSPSTTLRCSPVEHASNRNPLVRCRYSLIFRLSSLPTLLYQQEMKPRNSVVFCVTQEVTRAGRVPPSPFRTVRYAKVCPWDNH